VLSGNDAYELVKVASQSAADLYEKWSGGNWLSDAGVESLLQVEMARVLFEVEKGYITMETSLKQARAWDAALKLHELPESLTEKSRFDLCVWGKRTGLTGILEVKRSKEAWQQTKDMQRMRDMIGVFGKTAGGTLRYTMVAMYLWGSSERRLKRAENNARNAFVKVCKNSDDSTKCAEEYFGYYDLTSQDTSEWKQGVAIAYFA
jgi:hypothetical protein